METLAIVCALFLVADRIDYSCGYKPAGRWWSVGFSTASVAFAIAALLVK